IKVDKMNNIQLPNEKVSRSSTLDHPIMEIRAKTVDEEIYWLQDEFKSLSKQIVMSQRDRMLGPAANDLENVKSSCSMKFSNFLDFILSEKTCITNGLKKSGPSEVMRHANEVFVFEGRGKHFSFSSSFAINGTQRLAIYCNIEMPGGVEFGIGFIRGGDLYKDHEFWMQKTHNEPLPDKWNMRSIKRNLKLIVSQGNYMAQGRLTWGPRPELHIEIIQFEDSDGLSYPGQITKDLTTLKSDFFKTSPRNMNQYWMLSCNIAIVNRLSANLKRLANNFNNCGEHSVPSSELSPLQGETFFVADNKKVEIGFSYKIVSTDLEFVVTLNVGHGANSFTAAFVRTTDPKPLVTLKNVTHDYVTLANATEGVKYIQIRNIRAGLMMSEDNHSFMEISIFTV
ncbi:unnamed protein product, partial [Allacma fusca]